VLQDLEAIEPDYYKNMCQILEYELDMLGLELTFSAELNQFGKVSTVNLIENGQNVAVTDTNKADYVRLVAHHRMTTAIKRQIDAFLEGFHELVPAELVSIFEPQELELFISGLPEIDLEDLRAHTDYHGYKATDVTITRFWRVMKGFDDQEKALFLQFVTGTAKVPLEGFAGLYGAEGLKRFNIHKAYGTHLLPAAHTCFNQLDLPDYPSEEVLKDKLLIALRHGSEGFGFA
jgi:E3 ubiquitin-protein ligase HUWE1